MPKESLETKSNVDLDEFVKRLEDHGNLYGYAAADAAKCLVTNWKAALGDGANLTDLVEDVNETISRLDDFRRAVLANNLDRV